LNSKINLCCGFSIFHYDDQSKAIVSYLCNYMLFSVANLYSRVTNVSFCVGADEALKDVSLDKFLARNTSEDNVSFSEIMAEAEKKRRLKHAWLYEKVDEQLEVNMHDCLRKLKLTLH